MAGSSIVRHLTDSNNLISIRAGYYKNTSIFHQNKRVEYVYSDLRSMEDCRRMAEGCDAVVLTAAVTAGAYSINRDPMGGIYDNLLMNSKMLEACYLESVKRVILVGSAVVYQDHDGFISEEDLDLNQPPSSAYFGVGWMRRYLEKIAQFWHEKYGLEVIIIRLANIYGPYAKFDPKTSNFIPALIRKAVERTDPFEVWGSPKVTRDVLYVDDFARAIRLMLESADIKYDVFNIGSGTKITVGDVVDLVLNLTAFGPEKLIYREDRPSTMKVRALDCSKAKRVLRWEPQYTAEQGIKETIRWWVENRKSWMK